MGIAWFDGEEVAEEEELGVVDAIGVGVVTGAASLTKTPLFQIKFFPDLIQVYLLP